MSVLDVAKTIAAGAITLAALSLAWTSYRVGVLVGTTPNGATLQSTLDKVNAPCAPVAGQIYSVDSNKPCGTLADINTTLRTVRGTFGTVEKAGRHYDQQLAKYDAQEAQLFKELHSTIIDFHGTAIAATDSLSAAAETMRVGGRVIGGVQPLLTQGVVTLQDLDKQITNPAIPATLNNIQDITKESAGIMVDTHKMTDHLEQHIDAPPAKKPWLVRHLPMLIQDAWEAWMSLR